MTGDRDSLARAVRARMAVHALPDCRFGLDLDAFIPGFAGAEQAATRLMDALDLEPRQTVFVTPDNSIQPMRAVLLSHGHRLVMPTYGLMRGFIVLGGEPMAGEAALVRSWLEGAEHFGRLASLADLAAGPPIGHVIAGAAGVSRNGVRMGMGAYYLDIEFPLLAEAGVLAADARVHAIVHACQIVDGDLAPLATDVLVDTIATADGLRHLGPHDQPRVLDLDFVDPALRKAAPLVELRRRKTQ